MNTKQAKSGPDFLGHSGDRETLLREMYHAAAPLQDTLPKYIQLLIECFVEAYSNLPQAKSKQETAMTVTPTNIGEYDNLSGAIWVDEMCLALGSQCFEKRFIWFLSR